MLNMTVKGREWHSPCGHGALPRAGGAEPRPTVLIRGERTSAKKYYRREPAGCLGEALISPTLRDTLNVILCSRASTTT